MKLNNKYISKIILIIETFLYIMKYKDKNISKYYHCVVTVRQKEDVM